MSEEDDSLTLVIDRPAAKPERPEETVAPGKAFATVTGQRQAPALEFICATANPFQYPMPACRCCGGIRPALILLEYPGLFTVCA